MTASPRRPETDGEGSGGGRRLWASIRTHPWHAIALAALALRLALAAPAIGEPWRLYVVPDSYEYEQLAINLVAGRGYSQAVAPPYEPDVRRTPVYPLALAAVYAVVGHRPAAAIVANVLLGVLACLLTAALGRRLLGPGVGIVAGLFLALDLTSAAYSLALMSETLFTVLLLLVMLAVARYVSRGGAAPPVEAALWCGLAILARPIGLFLPLVLGPALALLRPPSARRSGLLAAALFALLALAFPLGWAVRNYQAAGVAQLTSLVAINAYYHRAAAIEAARRGVPVETVRRELAAGEAASQEPADLAAMQRRAWEIVLADPVGYVASHLRGIARLVGPDRDIVVQLRAGASREAGPPTSVAELVTAGPSALGDVDGPTMIVATLQLTLLYALAVAGLAWGLRRPGRRQAVALLALLVLYFLVVSGPEAYARFRVPVMPSVALLAAAGARALWELRPAVDRRRPAAGLDPAVTDGLGAER